MPDSIQSMRSTPNLTRLFHDGPLLTKLAGDALRHDAEDHRNLVISLLFAFVVLSAFIAWRSTVNNTQNASVIASITTTPNAGNTAIIVISEGDQKRVVLGDAEIVVSVAGKGGIMLFDDRTPRERITGTATDSNWSEMGVGDCLIVRPFTVTMHNVNTAGTDRVTLVVAKLGSDVDAATCKIAPTRTPPPRSTPAK